MHTHHESGVTNCHGCSGSPMRACGVRDTHAESPSGWRLVLWAMGTFLGPGFLAIVGACCLGQSHSMRFVAVIAGLAVGMVGSALVAKRPRAANETTTKSRTP